MKHLSILIIILTLLTSGCAGMVPVATGAAGMLLREAYDARQIEEKEESTDESL